MRGHDDEVRYALLDRDDVQQILACAYRILIDESNYSETSAYQLRFSR